MTDPSTPSAEDLSGSIVVVGGGGHACAILDVLDGINRWEVLGLLDPALEPSTDRYGVRVLGGAASREALLALLGVRLDADWLWSVPGGFCLI